MAYKISIQTDQKNDDLTLVHRFICINAKNALKWLFVNVFLYGLYNPENIGSHPTRRAGG
jgi:hypothetical protein